MNENNWSRCVLILHTRDHDDSENFTLVPRNSIRIYKKWLFYHSGSKKMSLEHLQFLSRILGVSNMHFLAATAVKTTFFLNPTGIAL